MNRVWIRGLSIVLCLVMTLGLAACGNSSGSSGGEQDNAREQNAASTSTDGVDSASYVWKSEFKTVNTEDGDGYVQPLLFTEDGFYGVSQVLLGRREPVEGETETYEGQFDIYGPMLYFIHKDGSAEKLPNYQPNEPRNNSENKKDFYSNSEICTLARTPDGKLIALEVQETGWYDGPDELYDSEDEDVDIDEYYTSERVYDIVTRSTDGTELSRTKAKIDTPDIWIDPNQVAADRKGNLIALVDQSLLSLTPEGNIAWTMEIDIYIRALITLPDASVALLRYGNSGMEVCPVDPDTGKLGTPYAVPDEIWTVFPGNDKHELYYTSGLYLYGFKFGEEEPEIILEWLNCDISSDAVEERSLHVEADGSIIGVVYDETGTNIQTQLFTLKQDFENVASEKQILTIAQLDYTPDDRLTNLMVRFNRTHDNVRLEYVDYAQFNTEDDDTVGTTKFNTEVMAGKLPDIIPTGQIPYRQIAAKGMLEDLYPYLDADPELSREDFFPNFLAALEVNGGLFQAVPGFTVETLTGAASVVGETPGWTYDELNAALAKMPDGCTPLEPYITRDDVLSALLYADMDNFVDWSSGKVNFDSDSFKQMLEFVMQFPAEPEYGDEDDGGFTDNTQELIRQGKQMLVRTYLYGLDDILWNDLNFGGNATMIGWPTGSGVGHIMRLDNGFAISRTCANKKAAWEFIRSMLTESAQSEGNTIPSNRHTFEKQLKEMMTPIYQKDSAGNYLLDENGEKIQESRSSWMDASGEHKIYAMTQEQADEILEVIETCTRVANYDTSIQEIVFEQVQAYFAGQKSVDEVARLIQSKASIYINEQR